MKKNKKETKKNVEKNKEEVKTKKGNKISKTIIIIAAIIVIVIARVLVGYSITKNKTWVLYIYEKQLIAWKNGTKIVIDDEYEDDELLMQYANKNKNLVAYQDDSSIYLYDLSSKEKNKVASDTESFFFFSEDDKYLIYEDDDSVLMSYKIKSQEKSKIEKETVYAIISNSNNSIYYFSKKDDSVNFYKYNLKNDEQEKINSNIKDYDISKDNNKIIYLTEDNKLNIYDFKEDKNTLIDKDVNKIESYSDNFENIIFSKESDEEIDLLDSVEDYSDIYGDWCVDFIYYYSNALEKITKDDNKYIYESDSSYDGKLIVEDKNNALSENEIKDLIYYYSDELGFTNIIFVIGDVPYDDYSAYDVYNSYVEDDNFYSTTIFVINTTDKRMIKYESTQIDEDITYIEDETIDNYLVDNKYYEALMSYMFPNIDTESTWNVCKYQILYDENNKQYDYYIYNDEKVENINKGLISTNFYKGQDSTYISLSYKDNVKEIINNITTYKDFLNTSIKSTKVVSTNGEKNIDSNIDIEKIYIKNGYVYAVSNKNIYVLNTNDKDPSFELLDIILDYDYYIYDNFDDQLLIESYNGEDISKLYLFKITKNNVEKIASGVSYSKYLMIDNDETYSFLSYENDDDEVTLNIYDGKEITNTYSNTVYNVNLGWNSNYSIEPDSDKTYNIYYSKGKNKTKIAYDIDGILSTSYIFINNDIIELSNKIYRMQKE